MFNFESTGIVIGYLKQLLASFNLPKVRIYTREHEDYFEKNGVERGDILKTTFKTSDKLPMHFPYIKDGKLQEFVETSSTALPTWAPIGSLTTPQFVRYYDRDMQIPNLTKQLVIKNDIYDYYTHKYLGDYLRFLRDFDNINLMSLYNCFGNKVVENLDINVQVKRPNTQEVVYESLFSEYDSNYIVYKVPVKLFKEYTIALDSEYPVEFFCGLDLPEEQYPEAFSALAEYTYKKTESRSCFSQPQLYEGLTLEHLTDSGRLPEDLLRTVATRESELCLFIKVLKVVNSSIVVLEGDYRNWNDYTITPGVAVTFAKNKNYTVISDEAIINNLELNKITTLQLLQMNTGKQVPFADRLIEYLTGNAITPADEIMENTQRLLKAMKLNYEALSRNNASSAKGDGGEAYEKYLKQKQQAMDNYLRKITSTAGIWTEGMKNMLYRFMVDEQNRFDTGHDILGYVDKDVEKYYTAPVNSGTTSKRISLMNIETLEDE